MFLLTHPTTLSTMRKAERWLPKDLTQVRGYKKLFNIFIIWVINQWSEGVPRRVNRQMTNKNYYKKVQYFKSLWLVNHNEMSLFETLPFRLASQWRATVCFQTEMHTDLQPVVSSPLVVCGWPPEKHDNQQNNRKQKSPESIIHPDLLPVLLSEHTRDWRTTLAALYKTIMILTNSANKIQQHTSNR